ncbi:MAG: hypothetical protein DSY80_08145 [Desulfocapsa sp.]|nr:MAG: hypothetical protein DSY80_08145 [Desulfocapsa sp.]
MFRFLFTLILFAASTAIANAHYFDFLTAADAKTPVDVPYYYSFDPATGMVEPVFDLPATVTPAVEPEPVVTNPEFITANNTSNNSVNNVSNSTQEDEKIDEKSAIAKFFEEIEAFDIYSDEELKEQIETQRWICGRGYLRDYAFNGCMQRRLPTNAFLLDPYTGEWKCYSRYYRNDRMNRCDPIRVFGF